MRRNDIVRQNSDGYFFGRVIRVLDSEAVLWICSGLHIHVTPMSDLVVENDYRGYVDKRDYYPKTKWQNGMPKYEVDADGNEIYPKPYLTVHRIVRMTSLRRMKQRASRYHGRNVWKTSLDYEFISR